MSASSSASASAKANALRTPTLTLPWAAAGLAGALRRAPVELSAPLAPLRSLRPRLCECFAFLAPPPLPHRCALLAAATIVPPRLSITDHKVMHQG